MTKRSSALGGQSDPKKPDLYYYIDVWSDANILLLVTYFMWTTDTNQFSHLSLQGILKRGGGTQIIIPTRNMLKCS